MRWSECWIGFKWDSPHIRSVGSVRSVRSVVWFRAEAEDDDPRPFSGLQSVEEKSKVGNHFHFVCSWSLSSSLKETQKPTEASSPPTILFPFFAPQLHSPASALSASSALSISLFQTNFENIVPDTNITIAKDENSRVGRTCKVRAFKERRHQNFKRIGVEEFKEQCLTTAASQVSHALELWPIKQQCHTPGGEGY